MILKFKKQRVEFIYDEITKSFLEIINNPCGICIIKGIMTKFIEDNDKTAFFINEIAINLEFVI